MVYIYLRPNMLLGYVGTYITWFKMAIHLSILVRLFICTFI